jgi:hypothetical protein
MSQTGQKRKSAPLFDHLVGTDKYPFWNGNTERSGGLEIQHDIENRWLFNRQVTDALALENLIDEMRRPPINDVQLGSVSNEAT